MTYNPNIFNYIDPKQIVYVIDDYDSKDLYPQYENVLLVTDILPTYECLTVAIDGDLNMFANAYINQLMGLGSEALFLMIASHALQGRDVIIFCKPDLAEYNILHIVRDFVCNKYGIFISLLEEQSQTGITSWELYFNFICDCYMYNIYDCNTFLSEAKLPEYANCNFTNRLDVVDKLTHDLRPYVNTNNIQGYAEFFNNYLQSLRDFGESELLLIDRKL